MKTLLSVMANAAAAESGTLAELVGTQVVLVRQQIDLHLARARAAAAAQLAGQRCRLRPAVDGLLRAMQRLYAGRDLQIVIASCPEMLVFRGEAQDFQEMLGNLLDNAGKWAARQIVVSAARLADELRIDVDDDGPGIVRDQRAELLQRGVRGDKQIPGSGLGLAIVDDLARLYSGRLELLDAPLGGLRARLWLPAGRDTDFLQRNKVKEDLRGWQLMRCLFVSDAGMLSKPTCRPWLAFCAARRLWLMVLGPILQHFIDLSLPTGAAGSERLQHIAIKPDRH